MKSEHRDGCGHRDGWSPAWVILNTLATLVGSVAGSAALILYILEKAK